MPKNELLVSIKEEYDHPDIPLYFFNHVSDSDTCKEINWQDEYSNYNDYFCESGIVKKCVYNGKFWEKSSIESCSGKYEYCDEKVVDGNGSCSKYSNHFDAWLDYADTGVRVNKQIGDKLRLNIYSEQNTNVNINYDSAFFEGDCPIGSLRVSVGVNSCYLTVKSAESVPAESIHYDVEKEITIENKVEKVSIINSPAFLIVTDSEKLLQRFPNEENGVKAVLKQAYANAERDRGVVYDLSWYKNQLGVNNPFISYFAYNERITQPFMLDNTYSLAVSNFIREKCDINNDGIGCKDVMIVGDDFVVPHVRVNLQLEKDYFNLLGIINWGIYDKNIYSDSYYIQRSFDRTFADLDEVFSRKVNGKLEQEKRVKILLPASLTPEQRTAIDALKQTLTTKFNPRIEEISSTGVACNQVQWFDSLKGAALIIIGSTKSNPAALNCYPFLVADDTNSSVFIDINQWDNKENAVIIGSDHPNAIYAFNEIVEKGIYRDIHTKSWSLLDVGVGIGAGVVVVGGAAATIAGAPIVAGAIVIGGGAIVVGTSFANECIVKNYGGDNWGWCIFDVGVTLAGGKIIEAVAGKILSPAFKPLVESGGFKKVIALFVKITPKKSILILEESLQSGQLKDLGKMISKLSGSELMNTAKYINLWEGNAFKNAKPELNLVRVFDSPSTGIVLGDSTKTIKNAAVLRKGLQTGDNDIDFGMVHIRARHLGTDATASSKFPISYVDQDVIDLISDGLKYGHKGISNKPEKLVIEYIPKSWNFPMRIVVEEKTGNLISAFPTENMR